MRFLRALTSFTVLLVPFTVLLALSGCPSDPITPDDGGAPYDGGSCASDDECDDGRFCNGTERCMDGSCALGEVPDCDDGIACTTDRCSEARQACESLPADSDGDGFGAAGCLDGNDCDDEDPDRFPGNVEVCDAEDHDEDCDDTTRGALDEDGDGFESARCCNAGTCGNDCDDARGTVRPDGAEVCNGLDDDCDGTIDEGTLTAVYEDADRDGYGTGPAIMRCGNAVGYALEPGDCDDTPGTGVARSPGQPEFCDELDNDCDTRVDEMAGEVLWYPDADHDGFGAVGSAPVSSCVPVADHVLRASDCDDTRASVGPGSAEICNAIDDDCNGLADYLIAPGDYEDDDGDGVPDLGCRPPLGIDCDDGSAAVGPGTAELCDGRDNDCDALIDEDATTAIYFRDADGDGFGSATGGSIVACTGPTGFVLRGGDCDDASAARYPGAREVCNAIDDDCDGGFDETPAASMCSIAHATAGCGPSGRCVALACDPGYATCGGATECGVRLDTDLSNCGACGRTCSDDATALPTTCQSGACVTHGCTGTFADCNHDGIDGCEVDTASDALACGRCTNACPTRPHASAVCMGSTCRMVCDPLRYDCDGRADNGCESTVDCASCGLGRADCDGVGACEDLGTDPRNCGSCGNVCAPGASCASGACARVVQIVTGQNHTCARYEGGGVVCWGTGLAGSGGPIPLPVPLPGFVTDIASSEGTVCAALLDGRVFCWGSDTHGELGNGSPLASSANPVQVVGLTASNWSIVAGPQQFFVHDGVTLFGWGGNSGAQLDGSGAPVLSAMPVPILASGPLLQIAAGSSFVCAAIDDLFTPFACSGTLPGTSLSNILGPMGEAVGRDLDSGATFVGGSGHGGDAFACFGSANAGVHCAGSDLSAMGLGAATTLDAFLGTPLYGALGGSAGTTCTLDVLGQVRCVGDNSNGQLGTSTGGSSSVGVLPTGLPRAAVISDGFGDHSCAVSRSGDVWCWGANESAQCGRMAVSQVTPGTMSFLSATTTVLLEPIADAYVDSGVTNYGSQPYVWVDPSSGHQVFLRFDLGGLPPGVMVVSTRLSMTAYEGFAYGGDGSVYTRFVADDAWSETGINGTNQPSAGSASLGDWWLWYDSTPVIRIGSYATPALRAVVQTEADGDNLLSLRLESPGYQTHYRSREYATASERPQLLVEYALP